MRTSKKFLSMILAIMMVVGALSAAASSYAFDDVEDYQSEIALMSELGIVVGKTETEFGYGADIERWQMALFIARMMTGKVYNDYVNWYETENYTTFQDINYDQAMGAISYGNDNGIIKGYSETEFGPTDGITIQDAFTMAVRMLGYGSSAMDATYPWSYVDKAIKLDLDALLPLDYNNEDIATKEQIVAILYQALFAPKADGTTIGASKFNLTMDTVVITGTKRGNLFTDAANPDKIAADKSEYVTFNLLGEDGKVQANPSYYLPQSAFKTLGTTDLSATLKIGYSYDVVTKDDYTTLLYAKENDSVVVDQDNPLTGGADKDHPKDVTIGTDAYKAVSFYSTLGNNQGTKTTNDYEIVLYTLKNNAGLASSSYLRNATLDIVDVNGNVILYWVPHTLTGATTPYPAGTYMAPATYDKKTGAITSIDPNGNVIYRDPVEADWIRAAEAASQAFVTSGPMLYQAISDTYKEITTVNAYSDTILFDDDGDADYDRGIYIGYSFGKIGKDGDGYLTSDVFGKLDSKNKAEKYKFIDVDKYFNGDEDYEIKEADVVGKFALYAINPTTKVFYLKKTYETKIGFVTTVNKPARTITFDQVYFGYNAGNVTGTTYEVGKSTLPGGQWNDVLRSYKDFDTLKGRTVNYVVDEKYSSILRIVNYADDAGYLVVKNNVASLNTNGYANVLAYVNSNVATAITVASIDGYTNVTGASMVNYYLKSGDLFAYTKDALGMYHLTYIDPTEFTYFAANRNLAALGLNFTNGVAYTDTQKLQTLVVDPITGKPSTQATTVNYDDRNGVAKKFSNFNTTKDTVIILVNSVETENGDNIGTLAPNTYGSQFIQLTDNGLQYNLNFQASKGVPQDGAHITLQNAFDALTRSGARIFADVDGDNNAKFVYVVNGYWDDIYAINQSTSQQYLDSNDTIIFVDAHTMESMIATNQTSTGLGVSQGTVYQYTNAIDFIRGGLTSAYTSAMYNQRLYAGHFYYVEDGYVTGEAFVGATGDRLPTDTTGLFDIEIVKVSYIDKFVAVYTPWNGIQTTGTPVGSSIWETAYGKPIVYELGHENTNFDYVDKKDYITYDNDKKIPLDIVDSFSKIVNQPDSYATAYVYTGALSNRTYSGQKKLFITTAYSEAKDIIKNAYIKNLGRTLAHDITKTDTVKRSIFEITEDQYNALAFYAENKNDMYSEAWARVNVTLKLYDYDATDGTSIVTIPAGNVRIIMQQTLPGLTQYYLMIDDVAIDDTAKHSDPKKGDADYYNYGEAWLVWTDPWNTNEAYKMHLCTEYPKDAFKYSERIVLGVADLYIDANPSTTIEVGATADLKAIYSTIADWFDFNPKEWTSNNESIATVAANSTDSKYATVTGVAPGEATITFKVLDQEATVTITVVNSAASVAVTPTPVELSLDKKPTETLTATVTAKDTTKDCTDKLTWSVAPAGIVEVKDNGDGTATITAKAPGKAVVTAKAGKVETKVNVTVIDIVVDNVPNKSDITLKVGEKKLLSEYNPVEGDKFETSDSSIADVTLAKDAKTGAVTAILEGKSEGTATITYTSAKGTTTELLVTVVK